MRAKYNNRRETRSALAVRNRINDNYFAFFEVVGLSEAAAHTGKKYTSGKRARAVVVFFRSGQQSLPHFGNVGVLVYIAAVGDGNPHFVFFAQTCGGAV